MKYKTLTGKLKGINISKYVIDWNGDSLSNFQFSVKQFLYPYWMGQVILEEMPLAGTKLRFDFFNVTRNIGIECQSKLHTEYTPFFHGNSRSKYLLQIKRDLVKEKWCEINNIKLIEIFPEDVDDLCPEWFEKKYNITL